MEKPPRIIALEREYSSYKISELAELFCTYKSAQHQYIPHQSRVLKQLEDKEELSLGDLKIIEGYDDTHSRLVALTGVIIEKCRGWHPVAKSFNLKFESGAQVIIRPYTEGDELPIEVVSHIDLLLENSKTPTS